MVFVIAATNRPDIIDEAILRSGRIEKHLLVPLPTADDRISILRTIVRKIDAGNWRHMQIQLSLWMTLPKILSVKDSAVPTCTIW